MQHEELGIGHDETWLHGVPRLGDPPLLVHRVGVTLSMHEPKAQHEEFVQVTDEQLDPCLGAPP